MYNFVLFNDQFRINKQYKLQLNKKKKKKEKRRKKKNFPQGRIVLKFNYFEL